MNILQMFSYPFMQRALIAGVLVSLCAALLGVPLVLKRYSMIGDGLSHVSFGALAIAVALGVTPLYFSIPVVILAAFFLLRMATLSGVQDVRSVLKPSPSVLSRRSAEASSTQPYSILPSSSKAYFLPLMVFKETLSLSPLVKALPFAWK